MDTHLQTIGEGEKTAPQPRTPHRLTTRHPGDVIPLSQILFLYMQQMPVRVGWDEYEPHLLTGDAL